VVAGISLGRGSKPMEAVGGLVRDVEGRGALIFRRPFQWREFLEQSWFVVKVSLAPTLLVAIPFTVLVASRSTFCCANWARPT
jgi:phospholipid/cholesterol/gamma-HCH transport system permease protein